MLALRDNAPQYLNNDSDIQLIKTEMFLNTKGCWPRRLCLLTLSVKKIILFSSRL